MNERIVIKIGGATLFQPSGFEEDLRALLKQNQNAQVWMLAGGGDLVEAMRSAHRHYPKLGMEEMHWRCIELLDHTWAVAKEVFPANHSVYDRSDLVRVLQMGSVPGTSWVRIQSFYSQFDCDLISEKWLPKMDWSTTTDTLAWLLGKVVNADRVILMKQCECDATWSLAEAAHRGIIDTELAQLAGHDSVDCPKVELMAVASLKTIETDF